MLRRGGGQAALKRRRGERYAETMPLHIRLSPLAFPLALAAMAVTPAHAQDREVPYWASIRVEEVNMRVGPSGSYNVSWVYHRPLLPMKVLRLKEGWRLVEDPNGDRGWVLGQFLSRERTAIVTGPGPAEMRKEGTSGARLLWRVAPGVVGKLGKCEAGWCRFDTAGHVGFVEQARLWGAANP